MWQGTRVAGAPVVDESGGTAKRPAATAATALAKQQAGAALGAGVAASGGTCNSGHRMLVVGPGEMPAGYRSVYCDVCGKRELQASGQSNFHCAKCKYDECGDCHIARLSPSEACTDNDTAEAQERQATPSS